MIPGTPSAQWTDRLRAEQQALGRFRPWMIHSTYDQSPTVVFHFPLLQDYITVDEYGWTMLEAG